MLPNAVGLPSVGSLFADQFEILARIGEGGMGVVYRARQLKLQREVALKVLRPSAIADGYEQFRLEREAVSAARFRSQHVVDIYDWGSSRDGLTYLVMELLHGETLAQRLDRQRVVNAAQVAAWLRECSEALDEAAALGIVHRDIKPANIFLAHGASAGTAHVKLLDFGITKVFDPSRATFRAEPSTQSRVRLGTTLYMSPEQLRATRSVDSRADIWSLGVVAYRALAGRHPFECASEADLIVSILSDEPPALHLINPALSRPLSEAVARSLHKDPNDRYGSAGEFARALSAALDHPHRDDERADSEFASVALPSKGAPSRASENTQVGSETGASSDSVRTTGKRSRFRWSNASTVALAVALAFAATSAVAVTISELFEGNAPRTALAATPRASAPLPGPVEAPVTSPPLDNAVEQSAATAHAQPAASLRSPPLSSNAVRKSTLTGRAPPPRIASPVPSAAPAPQFERNNPYAN